MLRNFGGRPQELETVASVFFGALGLAMPTGGVTSLPVEERVVENLRDPEARHLMLLTENNAALALLFDRQVIRCWIFAVACCY